MDDQLSDRHRVGHRGIRRIQQIEDVLVTARLAALGISMLLAWPGGDPLAAGQEKQPARKLSLHLEAVKQVISAGMAPVLLLTLENVGTVSEKILKPAETCKTRTTTWL